MFVLGMAGRTGQTVLYHKVRKCLPARVGMCIMLFSINRLRCMEYPTAALQKDKRMAGTQVAAGAVRQEETALCRTTTQVNSSL